MRFRVAKQKNQTNSNLLGKDQGAITAAMYTIAGGKSARTYIFFRVGPPGKLQAASPQALKLDRSQALGYYKILKTKGKLC